MGPREDAWGDGPRNARTNRNTLRDAGARTRHLAPLTTPRSLASFGGSSNCRRTCAWSSTWVVWSATPTRPGHRFWAASRARSSAGARHVPRRQRRGSRGRGGTGRDPDEFLHGFEKRFVHRDGSARWIQRSIEVDDEEKVAYGIGRETTTSHEAEAALDGVRTRRPLADRRQPGRDDPGGADGDVILANPAMGATWGRRSDDFTKWNRVDVVDPNDASFQTYIEERERTGRARAELTLRRVDGTTFPADVSSASFMDAAGQKRIRSSFGT